MKGVVLLTCALLGGLVAITGAQVPDSQTQAVPAAPSVVFKTGIDLVALNVTVTDLQNKYVGNLTKSDFAIFEDGIQQDVSFFGVADVPLDLAILIDSSASMREQMPLVHTAAIGFARTLRPGDRGIVIGFNDRVSVLQDLTDEHDLLETAIRQTGAQGGTALNNAVYVALKELARRARHGANARRQAVAVLSDGEDTTSLLGFDEVVDLARRSGITVYTICMTAAHTVRRASAVSGRRYFSQAEYGMKTLAQETGGRPFFPLQVTELPAVYGAIADELASQYALGFTPKNIRRDGAFRRLIVRILSRPDARTRTRTGYIADHERRVSFLRPEPD